MVKTQRQMGFLRKVGKMADKAIFNALEDASEGMTELELGSSLVNGIYTWGGEDGIKILVVSSGERSSIPNAIPTNRVLRRGDLVRVDLLATISGYHSDVARTSVVGEPSERQVNIWKKIVKTHKKVLETIKPGVKASDVYKLYVKSFKNLNLTPIGFIGHRLGFSVHEKRALNNVSQE